MGDGPPRRYSVEKIDVNQALPNDSITRTETRTENREELLSRLRINEQQVAHELDEALKDAQYRRDTDNDEATHRYRTFWAIFIILIVAGAGASVVMFFANSPENQAFGRAMATGVIGALIGYLGGSMSNPIKKS